MEQAICPRCLGGGEVPPPDGSQDGRVCPDCSGTGGVEPWRLAAYEEREEENYWRGLYEEYVDEMNREYWA